MRKYPYLCLLNKNISVWKGNTEPPTKHHLWLDPNGTLKFWDGNEWTYTTATEDLDGLMSKEDKKILDGLRDSTIYNFKGSCKFAELPTKATAGDVYNITDSFTLDGKDYAAGTNIAYTGSGWDPLGGEYSELLKLITKLDSRTFLLTNHHYLSNPVTITQSDDANKLIFPVITTSHEENTTVNIESATESLAGLLSAKDKTTLDKLNTAEFTVTDTVDELVDKFQTGNLNDGWYLVPLTTCNQLVYNTENGSEYMYYGFNTKDCLIELQASINYVGEEGTISERIKFPEEGTYNIFFNPNGNEDWDDEVNSNKCIWLSKVGDATTYASTSPVLRGSISSAPTVNWSDDNNPLIPSDDIYKFYRVYLTTEDLFKIVYRDNWYPEWNYQVSFPGYYDITFNRSTLEVGAVLSKFSQYYLVTSESEEYAEPVRVYVHQNKMLLIQADDIKFYELNNNTLTVNTLKGYLDDKANLTDLSNLIFASSEVVEDSNIVDAHVATTTLNLTDTLKARARANIDAASTTDLDTIKTLYSTTFDEAESNRQAAEASRVEAENTRVTSENNRISAEQTRSETFSDLSTLMTEAIDRTTEATALTEQATKQAKEAASYAIAQGDSAQTTANELNSNFGERLKTVEEKMDMYHADEAYQNKDYCVGAWTDDSASPDADEIYGNKDICWDWRFYLIDCTDNAGQTTHPVGELSRKNLFRFSDGRFAPVVGITEDMQADSTLELYRLVDGEYTKYCEAGAYRAEDYLEDVLRPAVEANAEDTSAAKLYKLVDDEYVEAHALLPWETTETKYSIGVGYPQDLYLIDQVQGTSGKLWKGVFTKPTVWDGIDVTDYKLERTALAASPVTTVGNKARCFFFLYGGADSNTAGSKGSNNICDMFYNNRHYGRVYGSQINFMEWARNNNADTTASYPCAEGGYHALNTFTNCVEVGMGTKYIHNPNLYSSGISSNDTCNSEATWRANGGGRFRVAGAEAWSYSAMNTMLNIYTNTSGARTSVTVLANSEYPKEACMESQIAYSWAQEFGISEGTQFTAYDDLYWFKDVATGSERALINARLYKFMATTLHAYDSAGAATDYDFQVILRMGIYNGMTLCGDIYSYWGGGFEMIGTFYDKTNQPVKCYLEPNQLYWPYDKTVSVDNLGTFIAEKTFRYLGEVANASSNWARKRLSYSARKITDGGNVAQYECFYGYQSNFWNSSVVLQRTRTVARFRGDAYNNNCSPRNSYAYYAVSDASRRIGGSAQWKIS